MGIKERQERDREATSRAILDAARELFVSEGYRNVSIRKIAEKVAASTGAKVVDFAQYPGALPNTGSYVALIDALVSRLAAALAN